MGCIDWQMVEALATCVGVIIAAVAGVFLFHQLREQVRTTGMSAFEHTISILQDSEMREKRRRVFECLLNEKDANGNLKKRYLEPKELTKEEMQDLEHVSQAWDTVGRLLYSRLIPAEWVMRPWNDSLIKCWTTAHRLIRQYQQKRGRSFWAYFEHIAWIAYFTSDPTYSPYKDKDVLRDFINNPLPEYLWRSSRRKIKNEYKKQSQHLSVH